MPRGRGWTVRCWLKENRRAGVWIEPDGWSVGIIDQTRLPHAFATLRLTTLEDAAHAISSMQTRGAPLIGAVAAYGLCLALRVDASDAALERAYDLLLATRPTAVNLKWGLDEIVAAVRNRPRGERVAAAYARAAAICEEDVASNDAIGRHGLAVIEGLMAGKAPGAARQRAHPLQRRLAGDGGLGHRAGADLQGSPRRRAAPCLGRRDAPAQPGRRAHRLGAAPAGAFPMR